eukprot:1995190-Amphidinium_carterae.1
MSTIAILFKALGGSITAAVAQTVQLRRAARYAGHRLQLPNPESLCGQLLSPSCHLMQTVLLNPPRNQQIQQTMTKQTKDERRNNSKGRPNISNVF